MNLQASFEADFDARSPISYANWQEIALRFQDVDALGHVTSLSFLTLFETARILFVRDAGVPVEAPKEGWMLVNLNVDYHAQMHFPGSPRIGTRLMRLGRSSIATVQGLFVEDKCTANLTSTLVFVDRTTDRAMEIPEGLRATLIRLSEHGSL